MQRLSWAHCCRPASGSRISRQEAHVKLLRLDHSNQYVIQAKALTGQEFRTDRPFPLSFDPAELLEP